MHREQRGKISEAATVEAELSAKQVIEADAGVSGDVELVDAALNDVGGGVRPHLPFLKTEFVPW